MCVLTILKNSENNGTQEIGLVTPTPGLACNHTDTEEEKSRIMTAHSQGTSVACEF